jgi:hypothetical protein
VTKPGRYIGGEEQQRVKRREGLICRFVLAFPDLYEVGMSHLGTRILYNLINQQDDLACERAFSPWIDLEAELRARRPAAGEPRDAHAAARLRRGGLQPAVRAELHERAAQPRSRRDPAASEAIAASATRS